MVVKIHSYGTSRSRIFISSADFHSLPELSDRDAPNVAGIYYSSRDVLGFDYAFPDVPGLDLVIPDIFAISVFLKWIRTVYLKP